MFTDDLKELHDSYLTEWMRTEETLKRTERISNEVNMASVQELRYAGRRVVQASLALQNGIVTNAVRVHLIEAIENCKKANHDAVDASITFVHGELDLLVKKAGLDVVAANFPKYVELKHELNFTSEKIVASRKQRHRIDEHYEEITRTHLGNIVEFYLVLETSREVISAVKRRRKWEFWGAVVLVGLVIGVGSHLIGHQLIKYNDGHSGAIGAEINPKSTPKEFSKP